MGCALFLSLLFAAFFFFFLPKFAQLLHDFVGGLKTSRCETSRHPRPRPSRCSRHRHSRQAARRPTSRLVDCSIVCTGSPWTPRLEGLPQTRPALFSNAGLFGSGFRRAEDLGVPSPHGQGDVSILRLTCHVDAFAVKDLHACMSIGHPTHLSVDVNVFVISWQTWNASLAHWSLFEDPWLFAMPNNRVFLTRLLSYKISAYNRDKKCRSFRVRCSTLHLCLRSITTNSANNHSIAP